MKIDDVTKDEAAAVAHELQQVLARAWPAPASSPKHQALWLVAAIDLTVAIAREMKLGRGELVGMVHAMWRRASDVFGPTRGN